MATRATLYGWFSTKMKPTQAQFKGLIDTFLSKDEDTLGIDKVTNLQTTLNGKADVAAMNLVLPIVTNAGDASVLIPAGVSLRKFVVLGDDTELMAGTTDGGSELFEATPIATGNRIVIKDHLCEEETTIYFTGVQANTVIQIFKG